MKRYFRVLICLGLSLLWMPHAQSQSQTPTFRLIRFIARGDVYPNLGNHTGEQFAFNPDGTRIAAGADDETTVKVWDIASGSPVFTFDFPSATVSWSPDGAYIAATGEDTQVRVWDATTGAVHLDFPTTPCYSVHSIDWSPDSRQFVTSCFIIYDVETGEVVHDFGLNWGGFAEILWSPDGSMIATTFSVDETSLIVIWSVDGERLDAFWGKSDAAWSPDSTRLASITQIREINTGLPVTIIPELNTAIAWHPDSQWVSDAKDDGTLRLWDADSGELVAAWQGFNPPQCRHVDNLVWSQDGQRFAMNCMYGEYYSADNSLIIGEIQP